MSRAGGSYPHPVFGHGDDIDATFNISDVKQTSTLNEVICQFKLAFDDPFLKKLLEDGSAKLIASWNCNATLRRGWIEPTLITNLTSAGLYRFQISQEESYGRITVDIELVATGEIKSYRPDKANRSYGTFSFYVQPGDVLGIAGSFTLQAHKLYDPMQPPIDSIFKIIHAKYLVGPVDMQLDLSSPEYIRIQLATESYERFLGLTSHPDLQISMVVFPALVSLLSEIHEDTEEEFAGLPWLQSLNQLIANAGLDGMRPLEQAQRLLPNPILRGMEAYAEGEGDILE